jgi:hypothetical protein
VCAGARRPPRCNDLPRAATYPGLVLTCKPIGVLEVLQSSKGKKERNDRVFVVPDRSPFEGDLQDIRRLPSRAIKGILTISSIGALQRRHANGFRPVPSDGPCGPTRAGGGSKKSKVLDRRARLRSIILLRAFSSCLADNPVWNQNFA